MATIVNNPTPTPNSPKSPNRTPLFLTIIGLLLLAVIGLGIAYMNRGAENAELTAQYEETDALRRQVEEQFAESQAQLEEMRGSNEELNALIDQQKEELREQKDKVLALTRDSRNLSAARRELDELKKQTAAYLVEIEDLRAANAELAENNQRLTSERDILSSDLQTSRSQNESLTNERAVLVSEREQLTNANAELSRKVNIASVIKAENVSVQAQKQRNNGKWVNRKSAKNTERIYVCFNSLDNAVAERGEESFELRIINPNGETIQVDAEGSGVLTNAETGDRVPYTKSVYFDFSGGPADHCAEWNVAGQTYAEGEYVAELYNKGYFVGSGTLSLR